jgi:hypothetical protein
VVKKIRKVSKKGPKANYAVPLVMPLTALFGPRCVGKSFWHSFDDPAPIRAVLSRHLDEPLLTADRILAIDEYLAWGLRSSPGKVAGMFGRSEVIPMGPSGTEETDEASDDPRLGVLVLVALVKGERLNEFSGRLGEDFSEIDRVAFENAAGPVLQIIPGYDRLLYTPPLLAASLNAGIDHLNLLVEDAFEKGSIPYPGGFASSPAERLASIPTHEPIQT